jgi:hypothetical protein
VQKIGLFNYTTAVNYPEGSLSGVELEARHDMGRTWDALEGVSVGANATFIRSEVILPAEEAALFNQTNINAPMSKRDMTNTPSSLFNFFVTWDNKPTSTQASLFWTLQGDSLIAGATVDDPFYVPNIYATSFGTLNFSLTQELAEGVRLQFQAKNLLNPEISTVYRSDYIANDVLRTTYTKGIDLLDLPHRRNPFLGIFTMNHNRFPGTSPFVGRRRVHGVPRRRGGPGLRARGRGHAARRVARRFRALVATHARSRRPVEQSARRARRQWASGSKRSRLISREAQGLAAG